MKKEIIIFIALMVFIVVGIVIYSANNQTKNSLVKNEMKDEMKIILNSQEQNTQKQNMKHLITIETNFGDIQFETYDIDAPKTTENFISLINKGFYDGLVFHRVIKGFMIQGGDPNCSSSTNSELCGMGGPGYQFEDELNFETESYKNGYQKGVVAMANAGPNTNGSQFFIMLENYPLPHNYTIFGKVVNGQEVVDKIGDTKTDSNDKPLASIIMQKLTVEEIKN